MCMCRCACSLCAPWISKWLLAVVIGTPALADRLFTGVFFLAKMPNKAIVSLPKASLGVS